MKRPWLRKSAHILHGCLPNTVFDNLLTNNRVRHHTINEKWRWKEFIWLSCVKKVPTRGIFHYVPRVLFSLLFAGHQWMKVDQNSCWRFIYSREIYHFFVVPYMTWNPWAKTKHKSLLVIVCPVMFKLWYDIIFEVLFHQHYICVTFSSYNLTKTLLNG